MKIKLLRTTDKRFADKFAVIKRRGGIFDAKIIRSVTKIIDDVKKCGDEALLNYAKKYSEVDMNAQTVSVSRQEIDDATRKLSSEDMNMLKMSAKRIKAYHEKQIDDGYHFSEAGIKMGQVVLPLARIGIYAPGGLASYPSTVLMCAIPAMIAGVDEIILCCPQKAGHEINPYVAATVKICKIDKFFRVGGAQAISAMAYGTETIPAVDKIVGPGNQFVTMAKKMVYGAVDIDMLAGPSEVLIIADDSANPAYIAADMLAQAEHDKMASAILLTNSESIAVDVAGQLAIQLARLPKRIIATKALTNFGAVVITKSIEEAVNIANDFAPEHLELMTSNANSLLKKIRNAGSVFCGSYTPEALGDYIAGVNHVLPTAGSARFASPLGVYDFKKRMSFLSFSKTALVQYGEQTQRFARVEGLDAHAHSIAIRVGKKL